MAQFTKKKKKSLFSSILLSWQNILHILTEIGKPLNKEDRAMPLTHPVRPGLRCCKWQSCGEEARHSQAPVVEREPILSRVYFYLPLTKGVPVIVVVIIINYKKEKWDFIRMEEGSSPSCSKKVGRGTMLGHDNISQNKGEHSVPTGS